MSNFAYLYRFARQRINLQRYEAEPPRRIRTFSKASSVVEASTMFQNFPLQYLRAMDSSNFDPQTWQRSDVRFDIVTGKTLKNIAPPSSLRHKIAHCLICGNHYHITWEDGHVSNYSIDMLKAMLQNWRDRKANTVSICNRNRILWKDLNESDVRASDSVCLSFHNAITENGMNASLIALYEYGFVLVTDTPIDDGGCGVAALASALGGGCQKDEPSNLLMHYRNGHRNQIGLPHGTDGPLRTMYGTVWSTTSSGQAVGTSTADSSYGHDGLPLHTDMTYKYDPPGLQIFTMIQPAKQGGASVICDGFAAATKLRELDPVAFQLLSETARRYHCKDHTTGWHLEASGPVLMVDDNTNQIVMIRHNDLDRLPDLPQPTTADIDDFYSQLQSAHSTWDQILSDDSYRLVIQLQPGDTIVVANQRCLHGRYSFETSEDQPRMIMGCYVSQDELSSRFRMLGYKVW